MVEIDTKEQQNFQKAETFGRKGNLNC